MTRVRVRSVYKVIKVFPGSSLWCISSPAFTCTSPGTSPEAELPLGSGPIPVHLDGPGQVLHDDDADDGDAGQNDDLDNFRPRVWLEERK